jgi:hypothetical protein
LRVVITPQNIDEYGLDYITGNTREDLITEAAEMREKGYDMFVNIPDAMGGDKDAPTERNVFEYYTTGVPDSGEVTHSQESTNLIDQTYIPTSCNYRHIVIGNGELKWICNIHDVPSKHLINPGSHAPCLAIDPHGNNWGK